MLRVKPPWSASVRLLDERDRGAVLAICDRDPVTNVFVASRVRALGLEPGRLGAQMWGHALNGRLESLCYSGANLVPVAATPDAVVAFADRALRQGRRCSSVVGPTAEIQALWGLLRPRWGPAREVRPVQPVMVTAVPRPGAGRAGHGRGRTGGGPLDRPAGVALRQRLQHPGPRGVPPGRVHRGRPPHVGAVL